jgi:predicted component of type VI protein secretion system
MKKLVLLGSALALVSGMAFAQAKSAPAAKPKTHDVNAEFVSFDATAKTITIKDDKGQQSSVPVEAMALTEAKSFHAGDKVTLTCRDDEKGQHQAITKIAKRKA